MYDWMQIPARETLTVIHQQNEELVAIRAAFSGEATQENL